MVNNMKAAAKLVCLSKSTGSYFQIRNGDKYWSFPGGKKDIRDLSLDCTMGRELMEETPHNDYVISNITCYVEDELDGEKWNHLLYFARVINVRQPGKGHTYRFCKWSELSEFWQRILPKAIQKIKAQVQGWPPDLDGSSPENCRMAIELLTMKGFPYNPNPVIKDGND